MESAPKADRILATSLITIEESSPVCLLSKKDIVSTVNENRSLI